ncbi:hypothetical protein FGO68_gene10775 [Halteria grandinella]|uniref:Uncharacterized protein n=1 Tax=Halteria grandinella TaxID=5974 RepID=A0A8J8NQQ6_HALGN|nr:hypothetical protein FGO68_gene10775 [Halteria grandinella]
MTTFFKVNRKYVLIRQCGEAFTIRLIGSRKPVLNWVKTSDPLHSTFQCTQCSRTLAFQSSELWIILGTPCSLCEGISPPNVTEKDSECAQSIPLSVEVESESMKIAKQAYGGALQRFIRENPDYTLQFSMYRIAFIKCQPLIANHKLCLKYRMRKIRSRYLSFQCSLPKCKAFINIYINSSKNMEDCRYEFLNLEKHKKECKRTAKQLAPIIHTLKMDEEQELKAVKKPKQVRQRRLHSKEESESDYESSEEQDDEVPYEGESGESDDSVWEDQVEEHEEIINKLQGMKISKSETA